MQHSRQNDLPFKQFLDEWHSPLSEQVHDWFLSIGIPYESISYWDALFQVAGGRLQALVTVCVGHDEYSKVFIDREA